MTEDPKTKCRSKSGKKLTLTYLGECEGFITAPAAADQTIDEQLPAGPSSEARERNEASSQVPTTSNAAMEVDEAAEDLQEPIPASPVLWTFAGGKPIRNLESLTRPNRRPKFAVKLNKTRRGRVTMLAAANNFGGQGQASIIANDGACCYWSTTLESPIVAFDANQSWVAAVCENNRLHVLVTDSGKEVFVICLRSHLSASFLHEDAFMVYCVDGSLRTWNLRHGSSVVETSIGTVLQDTDTIVSHNLSPNAIPVLVTSKGYAYIYSPDLASWIPVNCKDNSLTSVVRPLHNLCTMVPNGFISCAFKDSLKSLKEAKSTALSSKEAARSVQEHALELLMRVAKVLDSSVEYRFLLAVYVQMLLTHGAKAKMEEVLEELDSTSEICGVSSSELRDDLQPLLAEFQRMMGPEKPDHRRSGLAFIK